MTTEREENETHRANAKRHLEVVKSKLEVRQGEFVSRRIDSRTIVMARPARIDDIIKQINMN